jgi:hypothetical protein
MRAARYCGTPRFAAISTRRKSNIAPEGTSTGSKESDWLLKSICKIPITRWTFGWLQGASRLTSHHLSEPCSGVALLSSSYTGSRHGQSPVRHRAQGQQLSRWLVCYWSFSSRPSAIAARWCDSRQPNFCLGPAKIRDRRNTISRMELICGCSSSSHSGADSADGRKERRSPLRAHQICTWAATLPPISRPRDYGSFAFKYSCSC